MQMLPDEELERAILREGHVLGHAFVSRMMDIGASPQEGAIILASMLVQVCAQCHGADLEGAAEMLGLIREVAETGLEPMCDYLHHLDLTEERRRG